MKVYRINRGFLDKQKKNKGLPFKLEKDKGLRKKIKDVESDLGIDSQNKPEEMPPYLDKPYSPNL